MVSFSFICATDSSLPPWMTSYRSVSFSTFSYQLTANSSQLAAGNSQLIAFISLPLSPPRQQILYTILANILP